MTKRPLAAGRASRTASELAALLAQNVEAVCRHYLPKGRREGRYWMVGDVAGTPGRSLYVRLFDTGRGEIGNWVDAATSEYGDLLDLIRLNQGYGRLAETLQEAERFLSLPSALSRHQPREPVISAPLRRGSLSASRRLLSASRPLAGSLAATYLKARGITRLDGLPALRFHPRCYYRAAADDALGTPRAFPALIAAVTDQAGKQQGAHRTWLDPSGNAKAQVATPRRAMGHILGHAVRFGDADDVMAIGEGIETMLSLREVLPRLPCAAASSSSHLAAFDFPPSVRRLYVARDRDAAGDAAFGILSGRARASGVELRSLTPRLGDFNDDLRQLGPSTLAGHVFAQLPESDLMRFHER